MLISPGESCGIRNSWTGKEGNPVRKPQELQGKGQAELRLLPSGRGWEGAFGLMEMFCGFEQLIHN